MKILITGISGQVGSALAVQARGHGHAVIGISRAQWDMAQSPALGEKLVFKLEPDLVINPAAFTNVDDAEDDEETALKVNADAPRALAKACKQLDIPLFQLSTDYVFDGTKEEPYFENEATNPINAYGRTKLAGELAIQEETEKFIILRTSWVFSKNCKNFVGSILRLAREREELTVVNDQYGGPTSNSCIADVLLKFANQQLEKWGVYHYSGQPFVSWYEFAKVIVEEGVKNGLLSKLPEIKACCSNELPLKAKRPRNSRLSQKELEKALSHLPCDWHKALAQDSFEKGLKIK